MKYLYLAIGLLMLASCSKKTAETASEPQFKLQQTVIGGPQANFIPKATIFRMNGPYENNVAVTLNPDGSLQYYPAPTDLTASSEPYDLGNGWWLNRQGIGSNSVFTKWTFDEYRKLKAAPSREEIKAAIIPGSGVTEILELPISISEARSNPGACRKYVP